MIQIIVPSGRGKAAAHDIIDKRFKSLLIHYAETVQTDSWFGTFIHQSFNGPDFYLNRSFSFIEKPVRLKIRFDQPVLMLSFLLDGELIYLDKTISGDTSFKNGRYHLCYENASIHPLDLQHGYLEYLHIGLSERYFHDLDIGASIIGPLLDAVRQKSAVSLHTPYYKITARMRKVIREIVMYKGAHAGLYIQSRINELVLQFLNSVSTRDFPEPIFTGDKQRLEQIIHYIDNNLDQKLTVQILAKQFDYSLTTLHKKFKRCFGMSLYRYIQERRMQKARTMIVGSQRYSVIEIALACGYSDSSNFLTAFKKSYGHSTSYYRMVGDSIQNGINSNLK